MKKELAEALVQEIMSLISVGRRTIAIWGIDEASLLVARLLAENGVTSFCRVALVDRQHDRVGEALVYGCSVISKEDILSLPLEILVITADADKESHLREFADVDQRHPHVVLAGTDHFQYSDPGFTEVLKSCLVKSYATGYSDSLIHLYQAIQYLGRKGLRGAVAEFGMFKGGTTEFLVRALRRFGVSVTSVYGFDSFCGFPPRRSVFDLYTNPDCEFTNSDAVLHHAAGLGIQVIEGDISETYAVLKGVPLILSFFDTDNYSPTRAAVQLCYEQTVQGGILAFDHYHSEERFLYTLGERMAAQDVLNDKSLFHLHGTGMFLKI